MKWFHLSVFILSIILYCLSVQAQQLISGNLEYDKQVKFESMKGQWTAIAASGPTDANGRPKKACTADRQNDFKHLVVLALTYKDWQLFYQQYPLLAEQLKRLGLYREIVPKAEKPLPVVQSKPKKYKKVHMRKPTAAERINELEERIQDMEDEYDEEE